MLICGCTVSVVPLHSRIASTAVQYRNFTPGYRGAALCADASTFRTLSRKSVSGKWAQRQTIWSFPVAAAAKILSMNAESAADMYLDRAFQPGPSPGTW